MLLKKPMSCRMLLTMAAFLLVGVYADAAGVGKLYVLGMGPAGPDLTAPRALRIVKEADVLLCSPRLPKRFEALGMKFDPEKMAFDPWEGILGKKAQELKKADYEAWKAQAQKQLEKVRNFVLEKLRQGKTVAMMDGGDPCVYGPSLAHLLKGFDENLYEVIPGMGAVNAASAALKRSLIPEGVRFAVLTSPRSLFGEEWEKGDEILRDLSKYESTMVLYMSLSALDRMAAVFRKYYPPDLPVAVVYHAGFAEKEKVLKSDLEHIVEDVKSVDEKWLGLMIVGKCAR